MKVKIEEEWHVSRSYNSYNSFAQRLRVVELVLVELQLCDTFYIFMQIERQAS